MYKYMKRIYDLRSEFRSFGTEYDLRFFENKKKINFKIVRLEFIFPMFIRKSFIKKMQIIKLKIN